MLDDGPTAQGPPRSLPSPFSPCEDAVPTPTNGQSTMPDMHSVSDTLSPTTSSHSTSSATSTSTPDAIQYFWNTPPQDAAPAAVPFVPSTAPFMPSTSLFMQAAPTFMPSTLPFMPTTATFLPAASHAMLPTCWPEDLLLGSPSQGYSPPALSPMVPDSLFYPTAQPEGIYNTALLPTPESYTYNTAPRPTLRQLYRAPARPGSSPPSPPQMTATYALPAHTTAAAQPLSLDSFSAQQLRGSFMLPTSAAVAGPPGSLVGATVPLPSLRRLSPTPLTAGTSALDAAPARGVYKAKVVLHSAGHFARSAGRWVYKGGETRLVAVRPTGAFQDLLQDLAKGTTSSVDQGWQLKYELPGSPEVLVDIIDDDDAQNMWDEWQSYAMLTGVKPGARSNKLHVYIQTPTKPSLRRLSE